MRLLILLAYLISASTILGQNVNMCQIPLSLGAILDDTSRFTSCAPHQKELIEIIKLSTNLESKEIRSQEYSLWNQIKHRPVDSSLLNDLLLLQKYYRYNDEIQEANSLLSFVANSHSASTPQSIYTGIIMGLSSKNTEQFEKIVENLGDIIRSNELHPHYVFDLLFYLESVNENIAYKNFRDIGLKIALENPETPYYYSYIGFVAYNDLNYNGSTNPNFIKILEQQPGNRINENTHRKHIHLVRAMQNKVSGKYREYIENTYLHAKTIDDRLNSIESILAVNNRISRALAVVMSQVAAANLYRTRLGDGLVAPIESLKIYHKVGLHNIRISEDNINPFIESIRTNTGDNDLNTLIIAVYLYQKTEDITYLNQAIDVIDGVSSTNARFWIQLRQAIREDNDLNSLMDAYTTQHKILGSGDSTLSLSGLWDRIKEYRHAKEELKTALDKSHPEIFNYRGIDLEKIQAETARDSSATICFYTQNNLFYRVYIAPDTVISEALNPILPDVLEETETLGLAVSSPDNRADLAPSARRLYQLLFGSLDDLLPDRLSIIADGPLQNVPFNALRRDREGEPKPRYLGVEIALNRQLSLGTKQLLDGLDHDITDPTPFAMAPAFDNTEVQFAGLRQAGYVLPPLYYSKAEVENLEALGSGHYLIGEDATVEAYHDAVTNHSIVHLATHAISSTNDGLKSRIYFTSNDEEPVYMTAADIGDQTINADLVTLSACETGAGGSHYLEGRNGLTRAYLLAGARSVVSSNWAIDDKATAEMMADFYAEIARGVAPDYALRTARAKYVERHPSATPYKWAAFDAYGSMRPVRWDVNATSWSDYLLWGLGMIVVAGGLLVYTRNRAA